MKKPKSEGMNKPEADFIIESTDRDPHGHLFYHPSILNGAVIGAISGGLLFAFVAWMVADGAWSVVGLGQMSAGNRGPGAFFGFVIGSAAGGLVGSIFGMSSMLRKNRKK